MSGEETPSSTPPPVPQKRRVMDAARAAVDHPPSRLQDQVVFWGVTTAIKVLREFGFPVVVALLLLLGGWKLGIRFLDQYASTQEDYKKQRHEDMALIAASIDRFTKSQENFAAAMEDQSDVNRSFMVQLGLRPPKKKEPRKP